MAAPVDNCEHLPPRLPARWLSPLRLGTAGGALPSHLLPAPMEGVTTGSFCDVLSGHGLVRCWVTPFLRVSRGVPRTSRLQAFLAPYQRACLPFVVQLMGTDIDCLSGTAARLAALGVAGIDLNCGCPSPIVVGNGAGGALLRKPRWIRAALEALRRACPGCGISVKLRTGFEAPAEMADILPAVHDACPDFVILHFRTVQEMYDRIPGRERRLAEARALLPHVPLIGSGDLFSMADAVCHARAGVDGVAPARGLLSNPWLLVDLASACRGEDVPERSVPETLALVLEMADRAADSGVQRNGFIVKLLRESLGARSALFDRLKRGRDLRETRDLLAQVVEGRGAMQDAGQIADRGH